jgi:membrane fusion protein, copper/silver efflux system
MKTIKQYFRSIKYPLVVFVALIAGITIGYGFRSGDTTAGTPEPHQHVSETSPQPDSQEEQILYICPMNCVPPMEKPGKLSGLRHGTDAVDPRRNHRSRPRKM